MGDLEIGFKLFDQMIVFWQFYIAGAIGIVGCANSANRVRSPVAHISKSAHETCKEWKKIGRKSLGDQKGVQGKRTILRLR